MDDGLKCNDFIVLGRNYNNIILQYSDILYFECRLNYVQIVTVDDSKYLYRATMSSLEQLLLNYNFVRIHSGFLVPINKIKNYKKGTVELIDGTILKVSRKYIKSFKYIYLKYLGG